MERDQLDILQEFENARSNQTTHAHTVAPSVPVQPVVSGWEGVKASGNLLTAVAFMAGVVVMWKRYRLEKKQLAATSKVEDKLEQVLRGQANEQLLVMKELNESLRNAQRFRSGFEESERRKPESL